MDLKGLTLDEWLLKKAPKREFPSNNINYGTRYSAWAQDLFVNVHPFVNAGAQIKDGGYLTDHGPDHVRTVIRRATALISMSPSLKLTGYEVYLLLAAIHAHDVGNIFGREQHERRAEEILNSLGKLFTDDDIEKRFVSEIAQAHGGKPKDKIEMLPRVDTLNDHDVRMQLLAAILKFADELADDKTRAARYLLERRAVPEESEIFHQYAYALHSVMIKEGEVRLKFELNKDQVMRDFGKGPNGRRVYLIDEIFERTWKTHLERVYCMRFLNPEIIISRIDVKIQFYEGSKELLGPIGYRLEEKGYPDHHHDKIYDMCSELSPDSTKVTGDVLKARLERHEGAIENEGAL